MVKQRADGSIKADAGGDLCNGKVDLADAELGIVAPGEKEQILFIEKKATSDKQARGEHYFTGHAHGQSKFNCETAQRLLPLFAPQGQTIAGDPGKFEARAAGPIASAPAAPLFQLLGYLVIDPLAGLGAINAAKQQ